MNEINCFLFGYFYYSLLSCIFSWPITVQCSCNHFSITFECCEGSNLMFQSTIFHTAMHRNGVCSCFYCNTCTLHKFHHTNYNNKKNEVRYQDCLWTKTKTKIAPLTTSNITSFTCLTQSANLFVFPYRFVYSFTHSNVCFIWFYAPLGAMNNSTAYCNRDVLLVGVFSLQFLPKTYNFIVPTNDMPWDVNGTNHTLCTSKTFKSFQKEMQLLRWVSAWIVPNTKWEESFSNEEIAGDI